jgi:hypothetical protein
MSTLTPAQRRVVQALRAGARLLRWVHATRPVYFLWHHRQTVGLTNGQTVRALEAADVLTGQLDATGTRWEWRLTTAGREAT